VIPEQQRPLLRRELSELVGRLGGLIDSLVTHLPTFSGVVYEQAVRCGKPNCVCVREAQLHRRWCVSYLQRKRLRHRTLPPESLENLQTLAARYRTLRQQRAEMNRLFDRMREVFDRLERSLRVPPSRLLPARRRVRPARKRGV
jgi:hypothetical protein